MAMRAVPPAVIVAGIALGAGWLVRPGVGFSAAIGALAVAASFIANALALGWARRRSLTAVQVVAYTSFVVRMGAVIGLFLALETGADWFSPVGFAGGLVTIIPVALYEAHLVKRGLAAEVDIAAAPAVDKEMG